MAEQNEREVLHHLIEICTDGERGFRTAADHVGAPVLKTLFADLAAQRKQFAEELVPHLHRLGVAPGDHDHAIVIEAERGEHAAINAYDEALNGMLPPTVTDLVEEQRNAIQQANERIRTVEMGNE